MATTPTFVSVIDEIRDLKGRFSELKTDMGSGRRFATNATERALIDNLVKLAEVMAGRLQDLSVDVSKLAINYSKEDLEAIMEAMSK